MSEALFKKIIEEIGDHKTLIIMYLNAEPFTDVNFFSKLAWVNKICKNAAVEISSNLSLLDDKKRSLLRKFKIDELRLSVFGFTEKTYEKMMPGLNWDITKQHLDEIVNDKKLRMNIKKISLVMINFKDLLAEDVSLAETYCEEYNLEFNLWGFLDRAGNVEKYTNKIKKSIVHGCEQDRPLNRLHVAFDGKVVLCCQDWKREHILGDFNKDSLLNIWTSEKYNNMRERIYSGTTNAPELCKKCKLAR
jgi:radical SAM protein with 4Fe4S-binding SPASM domain